MGYDQDITDIRARISRVEAERDDWQNSSTQDKYFQAYFLLNALELQLNRLQRQRREAGRYQEEMAVTSPGPMPSPIRAYLS